MSEKNKSYFYKIRISLLIIGGLLCFYWLYSHIFNISFLGIREANQIKKELPWLFASKQYDEIIRKNFYLLYLDSSHKVDNYWNLACTYYLLGQRGTAQVFYDTLLGMSNKPSQQARALQQLGNVSYLNQPDSSEYALNLYKESFYLQSDNDFLCYNYELLKKRLDVQKAKNTKKQSVNSKKNKEPAKSKDEESPPQAVKNDFLEAISNQEQEQIKKYQLRKTHITRKDKDLPDW